MHSGQARTARLPWQGLFVPTSESSTRRPFVSVCVSICRYPSHRRIDTETDTQTHKRYTNRHTQTHAQTDTHRHTHTHTHIPPLSVQSWVLHGYPTTRSQATAMQTAGHLCSHFVDLRCPNATAAQRAASWVVDDVSGKYFNDDWRPAPEFNETTKVCLCSSRCRRMITLWSWSWLV